MLVRNLCDGSWYKCDDEEVSVFSCSFDQIPTFFGGPESTPVKLQYVKEGSSLHELAINADGLMNRKEDYEKGDELINDAWRRTSLTPISSKPVNIQDMLNCRLPLNETTACKYLIQVKKRAEICIERNQLENALKLLNRGIACATLILSGDKERWLGVLYEIRLNVVIMDPDAVGKCDILTTLMRVVSLMPELVVTYDVLRVVYGENQSFEKLDSMLEMMMAQVERDGSEDPPDVLDAIEEAQGMVEDFETESSSENWSDILNTHNGACCNCRRVNAHSHIHGNDMTFDFYTVYGSNVKAVRNGLRSVISTKTRVQEAAMELCSECHLFLWRDKNYTRQSSWVDTWPSFYWHLLSGSDRSTGVPFACTYGGEYIWKLIPDSLREYWRPSVSALLEKAYPFVALGGEEPPSFFRDITSTVATFRKEVSCYTYGALLKVLEPSRVGKEYDTG